MVRLVAITNYSTSNRQLPFGFMLVMHAVTMWSVAELMCCTRFSKGVVWWNVSLFASSDDSYSVKSESYRTVIANGHCVLTCKDRGRVGIWWETV